MIPDGNSKLSPRIPFLGAGIPLKYRRKTYVNDVSLIERHPTTEEEPSSIEFKKSMYSLSGKQSSKKRLEEQIYNAKQ